MAYPQPTEVAPWYLRNITQALALNETTGNVYVRTDATLGNVTIAGNVNIPGFVDTHVLEFGNVDISGNTLPISGNVSITSLPEVEIKNDIDNPIPISANTSPNALTNPIYVSGINDGSFFAPTQSDAFGRLRVSDPYTLFDSQNMYKDGGQFSNVTASGGTITYIANESSFNLAVTSANGSSVITQSKTTQPYQPGKSLLSMHTFAMAPLVAGCRQRVGQFTEKNGIYFEADGEDLYLVIRSSASGSVTEERIIQTSWNTDTLKTGSGPNPSGINLDPTLVQIFWSDIEWLGVGNVRAGFVINGQFIICHVFQHANQSGNTKVYMTSATLNPRYEITNTANTAGARTMKQICSTVISEGGYSPSPSISYVSSGIRPTRISSANVYVSLATIRLNPDCIDAVIIPAQIDLLLTDVQYGAWQLVRGASNVAALTYANVNGGVVQANLSAVEIGDGEVVYAGVSSSRDTFEAGEDLQKRLQLQRYANGTPITLTLCAGYGQANADLIWKFGWQEITN